MEQPHRCEACNSLNQNDSGRCPSCESSSERVGGSNPSLYNLDANLVLLSERLATLVQALQDLTNRMNSGVAKKDPASEEMISKLPWVDWSQSECSICLCSQEKALRQMPCGHIYHNDCLVPWLKQQRTCPQCRCELVE